MQRIACLTAAALLLLAGANAANAKEWSRQSTTTGPHGGQSTFQGSGSCAGGSCSSSQRWTGPRGKTATRSGSTTCSSGSCQGSATYTGPNGKTVTRQRSSTRN